MGLKPLVNANDFEIQSSRLSEKFTKDLSRQDSPSNIKKFFGRRGYREKLAIITGGPGDLGYATG